MPLNWEWNVPPESTDRADRTLASALLSGEGHWSRDGVPIADDARPTPPSRSRIQQLMAEGKVTRFGAVIDASAKLHPGDAVRIELPDPKPLELIAEDIPIEILHEDEHLLVVNKPAGLTVHPSETQTTGTLVHALLHSVKDLSGIGGVLRPGIVHRLDKDTSGALVVTKTDAAHAKLVEVFSKHEIERRYWALCYGDLIAAAHVSAVRPRAGSSITFTEGELRIESTLGRSPVDRKKMAMNVEGGRTAITRVRRVEGYSTPGNRPFGCFLEAQLETGRTHQVRVHLAGIGHSLLGDPAYGTPGPSQPKWKALPSSVRAAIQKLSGQALHARVLGFEHPITGKPIRVEAEPPEAFRLLQELLKGYR